MCDDGDTGERRRQAWLLVLIGSGALSPQIMPGLPVIRQAAMSMLTNVPSLTSVK